MKEIVISRVGEKYLGAILEDGKLVEVFSEDYESIAGNIYVGRVERIVTGLDGAFVNIGTGKNAFLRFRDVPKGLLKSLGVKELREGSGIIVQVKKDATQMKGAQVTGKISLAGRYVVYFPVNYAKGISRRISEEERKRLLLVLSRLRKRGEGIVIRTAAEGVSEEYIERELQDLRSEWKEILGEYERSKKPRLIRKEPGIEEIILRDRLDRSVMRVFTNDQVVAQKAKELAKVYGDVQVILLDSDPFQELSVYRQMEQLTSRIVRLESGAFIVIDTTEALTVIDVNSASFTSASTHEELVLKANLEAAREIARQIRLRNIGGMILVDFITMSSEDSKRKVIEVLKEETKKDRSRVDVLGFTRLGLLEMTRKRSSPPLESFLLSKCPVCGGSGRVLSPTLVLSKLESDISKVKEASEVRIRVHRSLSGYLNSEGVRRLERRSGKNVVVSFDWCDPNGYDLKFIVRKGGRR